MPRPLKFMLGDNEFSFTLKKVDRSKLYGFKDLKALDETEQLCEIATLADDGRTLIGKGGTGLGWLDADGKWCEKSELKPVDTSGEEIQPVPSSYAAPVKLFDTATVEDYLEHNVRLVYAIDVGDADASDITDELDRGTIFKFDYSYRGGLEADTAFLLNNEEGTPMMAVGDKTKIEFLSMAAPVVAADPESEDSDSSGGMMDFDMI